MEKATFFAITKDGKYLNQATGEFGEICPDILFLSVYQPNLINAAKALDAFVVSAELFVSLGELNPRKPTQKMADEFMD